MLTVTILSYGKIKDNWLKEALLVYQNRLKGKFEFFFKFFPDLCSLEKELLSQKSYIALDSKGYPFTSLEFSKTLFDCLSKNHSKIFFVIGGADGLSATILKKATKCWSLSFLTFPHQFVFLILFEQIYRAYGLENNHPYPR